MGCCASDVNEGDWDDDEMDEVKALIRDKDAAGNPIMVSLSIEARGLGTTASSTPSSPAPTIVRVDAFAVVFEDTLATSLSSTNPYSLNHSGTVVGRTETQYNTPNPKFENTIVVPYKFEEVQHLSFRFFDEESKLGILREQGYLGEVKVELATLWSESPFHAPIIEEETGVHIGDAVISATEVKTESVPEEVVAVFKLSDLHTSHTLAKTQPFITVSRVVDQEVVTIAKTESRAFPSKLSEIEYSPLHVKVDRLCKGDYNALLVLEAFTRDVNGRPTPIGLCRTNLATLLSEGYREYELVDDIKKINAGYTRSGVLTVMQLRVEKCHTFLDFVRSGFDINLTVAIDFTKSNKPFDQERSLHYRKGDNKTNEYVAAIEAVGGVMCCYDQDQEFPVYGFGARLPDGNISHCFPCTMMQDCVEVSGLDGIAEVYWSCLKEVDAIEPTNLAHVIRKVSGIAREKMEAEELSYQVLLIITDGAISDMRQTIDAVVAASGLPISILIVGVGSGEDFAKMRLLDADDVPLVSSNGDVMTRDIVGFVPFREHRHLDQDVLARECLREIPRQFTTWTRQNRISLPAPTLHNGKASEELKKKRLSRRALNTDNPNRLPATELERMEQRRQTRQSMSLFSKTKGALKALGGVGSSDDLGNASAASLKQGSNTQDLSRPLLRRHPSGAPTHNQGASNGNGTGNALPRKVTVMEPEASRAYSPGPSPSITTTPTQDNEAILGGSNHTRPSDVLGGSLSGTRLLEQNGGRGGGGGALPVHCDLGVAPPPPGPPPKQRGEGGGGGGGGGGGLEATQRLGLL